LLGPEGAVDVEVTARDSDSLGDVLPALARTLGVPVDGLWENSVRLPDELPLTAPALAHGAVLGIGRPGPAAWRSARGGALELHVVGGPDAGRALPLGQGRHVVGRGSEATVPLQDPDVSRRHVAVHVGGGRITVADLGSTNGSRLEGHPVGTEARPWAVGDVLRLGASALTIAAPVHAGASITAGHAGRSRLRPPPRLDAPPVDVEVTFPAPPVPRPPRRLALVAMALPAVGGVLMAWLLSAPTFLFFALLSPVVALGTWLSERWTGRRSGRQEEAAHAVRVLEAQERLDVAVRTAVRAADSAHPDLATLTTAARRRARLLWSRASGDGDALTVRLGVGPGCTGVTRVAGDGSRERQTAPHLPVVADLRRDGGLTVLGPRERAHGVLVSIVGQLVALHPPGCVDLLLLVDAPGTTDWAWARWLPHLPPTSVHVRPAGPAGARSDDRLLDALTDLVARRRATYATTTTGHAPAPPSWTVVIVDRPLDPRLATVLRTARDVGVLTLSSGASLPDAPVGVAASLHLTGETGDAGVLCRTGLADAPVTAVDRLSLPVAARFARDLAGLAPAATAHALPRSVRLLDLPTPGLRLDDAGRTAGGWSPARDRLLTVLGRTADGPVEIDLCRSGPHALVAGTTGSGKSELLQTLIASLALNHPPDRCSLLLVDYKGGAAFAEAAALPHTVGVVTDLDGQTTARALRSLTAELARREAVLAAHQVADIVDLPGDVDLARLVIVVDEFATLAEELPGFVPGLVSIAQRGRSLGVHLVLATQRPGGVVSPEIRANCSLRICLRTTDEAESRDVLGTPSAAHLPVDLPGRAYLRTGSAAPTLLQVARVATSGPPPAEAGPDVRRWAWPAPASAPPEIPARDSDLARLTQALVRQAQSTRTRSPHRPWRPPLPDRIGVADLPGAPRSATRLRLGIVDLPDSQSQRALDLDLADGGTWLAVGGPRSGRSTLLRTVLREAVAQLGPDDLHVHVIESTGGPLGGEAAGLPHTGTVISGEDRLRTVRLVERLAAEIAERRAVGSAGAPPRILLLVDGLEELTAVIDEAEPGSGGATLTRLLRDGGAAGLTCVVTADRAVPGGRLAAVARQRLVLPLADRADYAVAGVPPSAVPTHRPPGRALVGEDPLECQLAVPRPLGSVVTTPTGSAPRPLRIPELAADPDLGAWPAPPVHAAAHPPLLLAVGPGGDEGEPLVVDLSRTGGLLVAGPPGSGPSAALDAFARDLHGRGTPLLRLGRRPSSPGPEELAVEWAAPSDEAAVHAWLSGLDGRPGVLVADDLGAPAEVGVLTALASAAGGPVVLLAAAQAAQLAAYYQGPVAALRRARTGLLLCPGPGDADLLGVRLPRTPVPVRPGSGWLVTGGTVARVQVARRRGRERERR
jgi:S-DNA-T family DNA segregation ATPase FtsK/SpoIIIE